MQMNTSRILAFDPGETTGIGYVVDGEFRWGMVCRPECFDHEVFLMNIATMTQPTTIVIEIPPSQTVHYNKDQSRIYERLERFYRVAGWNVISINPGQWKKLIERSKIDATHIRDATDMAKLQYTKELTK
jgi:c-di-GMP-related signal transduction protein